MSRFDGFEELGLEHNPDYSSVYQPGVLSFDALISEMVRLHEDGTLFDIHSTGGRWSLRVRHTAEYLAPLLNPLKGGDISGFLDALVQALPTDGPRSVEILLNPVVQFLYEQGHNDFCIDLSPIDIQGQDIASGLEGSVANPLRLACRSNGMRWFGWVAKHCVFELYGESSSIGYYALESTFIVQEGPEMIAHGAENCIFRIPSLRDVGVSNPKGCTIYTEDPTGSDIRGSFLKDGNRLLVPDEDGGWKEVEP